MIHGDHVMHADERIDGNLENLCPITPRPGPRL